MTDTRAQRESFCEAALACRERLWAFAVRLTRDRAEAEDLLQMVYVRAFESWAQLRDVASIEGWMLRTMHRAFVDQCRRRKRSPVQELEDDDAANVASSMSPMSARAEAKDAVSKALAELTLPLAHAITLRDVWGFSYEEIAELMGCPIGTVRSRIARARSHMLAVLAERETDRATVAVVREGGRGA